MSEGATTTGSAFDRFIGVDWSGARDGGNVYAAEVVRGRRGRRVVRVEQSTRERVEGELALAADAGVRTLAGLDFNFSFPGDFVLDAVEEWDWVTLRSWAAALVATGGGDVGAALRACPERAQFRLATGDPAPALWRRTELACTPKPASVVHVIPYQRQVCLGSIHGMAMLDRLAEVDGAAMWPFATGDEAASARVVLAEAYPSMWVGAGVAKSNPSHRLRQARLWQKRYGGIGDAVVDLVLDSEDAFDALAVALALPDLTLEAPADLVVDREGWIAGVPAPAN